MTYHKDNRLEKPDVPFNIQEKWQTIVDLMAKIMEVPAGLIMKIEPPQIEVFLSSKTKRNPYEKGERANLDTGLYCETVIKQRAPLLVPDALRDPEWDHNPDIKLGMIYYCGFPLEWPGGEIFGTICVLDYKDNSKATAYNDLISEFKQVVEGDLQLILEITERRRIEDNLKERTNALEEKTIQLQKLKVEAEKANQMKSIFLASMSHELRTPLNSIIGFTDIVLQGNAGELNDEQKELLGMAYGSAKHLLSLINDLLDVSKIESGELKLDIEEFNIAEVGIKIRNSLMHKAEEKELEFVCDIPDINISSDKRRFEQILLNLVNNALKFTEEGKVEVKAVKKDGNIEVIVRDSGIGIKKEDLHKLFQPFAQLEYTIAEESGSGLGLYLTKNLVQLLKGRIQMESEYRKGSTFTFILPTEHGG